jgi:DNA-directed RNA polymerase beta' subunit
LEALGIAPDLELSTELTFASAEAVRERAPKVVTAAETLDFKTLMPVAGGLFDYKVFGPGTVIDAPAQNDAEPFKPKRTQFGRIQLAMPLVHPLSCENTPQRMVELAALTDKARDCTNLLDDPALYDDVVNGLELAGYGSIVMRELAVLPPDLRPLRRLDDDRWAVSPLNDLYRRVVSRNGRLAHVVETNAPAVILASERRQLHEAMHQLFAGELRSLCGGSDGFTTALCELDRHPPGETLTGKLYRTESVLFALGFLREQTTNDASREAAA